MRPEHSRDVNATRSNVKATQYKEEEIMKEINFYILEPSEEIVIDSLKFYANEPDIEIHKLSSASLQSGQSGQSGQSEMTTLFQKSNPPSCQIVFLSLLNKESVAQAAQFVKTWQKQISAQKIKTYVFSAFKTVELKDFFLKNGVTEYFVSPFQAKSIQFKISLLIKAQRSSRSASSPTQDKKTVVEASKVEPSNQPQDNKIVAAVHNKSSEEKNFVVQESSFEQLNEFKIADPKLRVFLEGRLHRRILQAKNAVSTNQENQKSTPPKETPKQVPQQVPQFGFLLQLSNHLTRKESKEQLWAWIVNEIRDMKLVDSAAILQISDKKDVAYSLAGAGDYKNGQQIQLISAPTIFEFFEKKQAQTYEGESAISYTCPLYAETSSTTKTQRMFLAERGKQAGGFSSDEIDFLKTVTARIP